MFADISGSAGLFEHLGQAEAAYAIERCVNRMSRSIEGYGGLIGEMVGDELLASFETAAEACLAAIDMQQRIADLPAVSGHKLSIRIGIHAGQVSFNGQKPVGETVTTTARIAGIAGGDQILASSVIQAEIIDHPAIILQAQPGRGTIRESTASVSLFLVRNPAPKEDAAAAPAAAQAAKLTIRYRGKSFLMDEKSQTLTFGRDLGCKILVEDRKASRQHARIELRPEGFFLVDTSTNGSFVSFGKHREVMVRHHEMRLEGEGWIAFGNSGNDPSADKAEFSLQ
ncbi:adenylate/guanylate cyclase domain-containing protein [Dechloromonas denitrificans]|uniref:adenylate/guanylate cyclase domain-containing protein n=1 Tax=Dechloromonas denitrificans TaxID=281362 RepID=UPI001CF8F41D|nr:adenylate/guanylate cyclase domain-containing protein [Dechloromonas denitrificans]UCV11619.1 adenylate/guanylate cyclase domain-containing protein [Dechloromonas denitrificans]